MGEPYFYPDISPDGNRIVVSRLDAVQPGIFNIWLLDLVRGSASRFTFGAGAETFPVWSPDGRRIVFGVDRTPDYGLYWKDSSGAGNEELLLKTAQFSVPADWSRHLGTRMDRPTLQLTGRPNGLIICRPTGLTDLRVLAEYVVVVAPDPPEVSVNAGAVAPPKLHPLGPWCRMQLGWAVFLLPSTGNDPIVQRCAKNVTRKARQKWQSEKSCLPA